MSDSAFEDFRLVGGTGLSLQRGHRISEDIDLFTSLPYGDMPKKRIQTFIYDNFIYHDGLEELDKDLLGYTLYIGDNEKECVKLDLFYTEPFIFPQILYGNIRMADERDIAAMKVDAIVGPPKRIKDYWDFNELLESYTVGQMIAWALEMFPFKLSEEEIIDALLSYDDVDEDSSTVICLKGNYWDLVKLDIKNAVTKYIDAFRH